ncbi:SGNH/GDSL hydrolase family protein [uncultured Pseudokineococcus sp.]|uniref:SGNH/GDSL hydrolase family protein n=1 Tax=uncultured Pseudokineococcus sp. TaxID=1642928 RepID=UPI0026059F5A|nr:SGNH/GDSL hydrolase family protein [uncultured Pseudokineococcus sp.]
MNDDARWVHTWACMPQRAEAADLPPAPEGGRGPSGSGTTLRQTVRTSVGGRRLRVRLSNAFGDAPLAVSRAVLARPEGGRSGARAVVPGTSVPLTFGGRASTRVPVGALVVSDPVELAVAPRSALTLSTHLSDEGVLWGRTTHPGSRTTSHVLAGDHAEARDLAGAAPVEHWYVLTGLEVVPDRPARAVVVLGDSLSDGRGSTTDGDDRWPDQLAERLRAAGRTDVAVVNQAGGGNRVLADGVGPSALARLDRDVLALSGAAWLLVLEGINDLGTAAATASAQRDVAEDLVRALDQVVLRARARGLRALGATLLPFGGSADYDDPAGHRERSRQRVNHWIRTSGRFDAVLDLDRAARDPARPDRLLAAHDVGDHLHLGPAGHAALAAAVPLDVFR